MIADNDSKIPHRVWFELERFQDDARNEKNAALLTAMLRKLVGEKALGSYKFSWSKHERRYCYGDHMGYRVLSEDGEWFNLEFLVKQ